MNLGVLIDLGVVCFLDVQDLAPQGQDGLETTITALLGGATGRITLHDVDLRFGGIAGAAIGQLAGQGGALQHRFTAHQLPGPASCLRRIESLPLLVSESLNYPTSNPLVASLLLGSTVSSNAGLAK